jgi:hypothetical protein
MILVARAGIVIAILTSIDSRCRFETAIHLNFGRTFPDKHLETGGQYYTK